MLRGGKKKKSKKKDKKILNKRKEYSCNWRKKRGELKQKRRESKENIKKQMDLMIIKIRCKNQTQSKCKIKM